MTRYPPLLERLAAKSQADGECLVWTGSHNADGYGSVHFQGRSMAVHRAAWIARHGEPPPETPYVLHRCDNPPCFADEHLWLGTQLDNMRDKMTKGRHRHGHEGQTHCIHEHSLEDAYVYLSPNGRPRRQCRPCALARAAKRVG